MNRITLLLFAVTFLPLFAVAQVFDTGASGPEILPQAHGKSGFSGPLLIQSPAESAAGAANFPTCGFDEMNHQHGLNDPDFLQEMQDYIESVIPVLAEMSGTDRSTVAPLLTISVVVHVIHNGEPVGQGQNLSTAQIQAQLEILNEDFASVNPQFFNTPANWAGIAGVPNIEFCLASADPAGNPSNGITRHNLQVTGSAWNSNNVNSFIKPQTNWDPLRYFNIYVLPIPGTTSAGGVVGYSNYPTTSLIGAAQDGVVIDYRWFGAPGFGVSGWRALTHETGHFLGLPHTFNGNSCNNDDGIADTPNMDKSTREYVTLDCSTGYPAGPVSCGNQHLYVNYMDYVTENCYTSFTNGQVNVMRAVLDGTSQGLGYGSRLSLVQNAPAQCNIPAHDAGITRIIAPAAVTCTPSQLTPVVTLRNFGSEDLTTVNIKLKAGTGQPVSFPWQGSLFPGQSTDVTLPAFTPPAGQYTLQAFTEQPNGLADQRMSNDTTAGAYLTYVATAPPMWEDFEGETAFPVSTGLFEINLSNDDFTWELTNAASGFGTGATSVLFDNFAGTVNNNPFGTLDALVTRHFNFANLSGAQLKFNVAYAPFDNLLSDTLLVLVATNCSQNFNQLTYRKGGVQLSTAPATTQLFIPSASQWRTETIDLSSYDGMDDVTIAFINLSGWGNRLYLDDIQLGMDCAGISQTMNVTPNGCDNAPNICTGSAAISLQNHNGNLSYQWAGFPGVNQPSISQLCAGPIAVTVTDGFGCQVVASAMVPQAQPPALSASSTQVTTFGGSNGTAAVTVSGGAAPYNFTWSNGVVQTGSLQAGSIITGLAVGTYTVTVENANGCESIATVTVGSVCDNFTVNTSVNNAACNGGANGSVSASPQNGVSPFTYLWSNGGNSPTINNLSAGTYTVTVTGSNSCPAVKTALVQQPSALMLNLISTGETTAGAQNGTATVSVAGGTPGYTYLWSNNGTTPTITGLAPGTYTVTVMDQAGCTSTGSVLVNAVACGGFIPNISIANVSCQGFNNGSATVNVTGGTQPFTYNWSNGQTTQSISNLPPGQLTVTVNDQAGCDALLSVTITEPPLLTLTATSTNETAQNAANGTASATAGGGTGGYLFEWSNGATTPTISGLAPGAYSLTVTDANGCQAGANTIVNAYSCGISIDLASTPASCPDVAGGSAVVTTVQGGSGPYQYLWSNGATGFMISNLVANTYIVTVTDGNGCEAIAQVVVPSADVTAPVVLVKNITVGLDENGMAIINGSTVDNGSFDNCSMVNIEVIPSSFTCANIGNNQVTVLVTDSSNNSSGNVAVVTIVDQTPPDIVCPANLTVSTCGPLSYEMPAAQDACSSASLVLTSGFNSGEIFPQGTTPVTWTATDNQGNMASCTFTVTVVNNLVVEAITTQPSCNGLSDGYIDLVISGGAAPYTAVWSNGVSPLNLPVGTYDVTVVDANGCSIAETFALNQPAPVELEVLDISPASNGLANGSVVFSVNGGTGPYELTWFDSNGQPLPGFNPSAVAAGTYQVVVNDANGCLSDQLTIEVEQLSAAGETALATAVKIFPNPSAGLVSLQIDLPQAQTIGITAFDGTGRQLLQLKSEVVSSEIKQLDFQAFGPGVYWIKIIAGDAVALKKVVIH